MKPSWQSRLLTAAVVMSWLMSGSLASAFQGESSLIDGELAGNRDAAGVVRLHELNSYLKIRHFAGGQSVGFQDDFTSFELLHPFWDFDTLWFVDARYSLTNSARSVGNLGAGFRRLGPSGQRTWGASFWYDVDGRAEGAVFHQLGASFETLGEFIDYRSNLYFPVGPRQQALADPLILPTTFSGNNIVATTTQPGVTAMRGVDMEVGGKLPLLSRFFDVRGYIGGYYFDGRDLPHIRGIRGRIETAITPDLGVMVSIQNDRTFDTTAFVGVTWTLPVSRSRGLQDLDTYRHVEDRLLESVYRNYQVVAQNRPIVRSTVATDSETGDPLFVTHVDSSAPAGGDGTIENPFRTLAEAEAGSNQNEILFAHADSIFDSQSISLQNGQRFLGEGVDHFVDTREFGTLLLPRATDGTNLPVIRNVAGNAITVAADTEVSGFELRNITGSAIFGSGFSGDVNLNRLDINGAGGGYSVNFANVNGNVTLAESTVARVGAGLIDLDDVGGTFDFTGSTLSAINGGTAIRIQNSSADVTFDEVNIANSTDDAVVLTNNTGLTQLGTIDIETNGARGLVAEDAGTVAATGGEIFAEGGAALDIADTNLNLTLDTLRSRNSDAEGILLENVTGSLQVTNQTTIENSETHGIAIADSSNFMADFGATGVFNSGVDGGSVGHGVLLMDNEDSIFRFNSLGVEADNGTGLFASNSGILEIGGGVIRATNGPAIDLDSMTTNVSLGSAQSIDSPTQGLRLNAIDGFFEITNATSLENSATSALHVTNITNPSTLIDFGLVEVEDRNGIGIEIDNVAGFVGIDVADVNAPVAGNLESGIVVRNSSGTVWIDDANVANSLGHGIELVDNSGLVVAWDGEISGAAGSAFRVQGGSAGVFYGGDIDNSSGRMIEISGVSDGFVQMTGGFLWDEGGTGIRIENTDADVFIANATIIDSISTGIDIQGGSGDFFFNGAWIEDAAGSAFNVNGGSANITFRGNIWNSDGRLVEIRNMTGGQVDFLQAEGNAGNLIRDIGGDGILIANSSARIQMRGVRINGSSTGIEVQNSSNTINFLNTNINGTTGDAVSVTGGTARVAVEGDIFNSSGHLLNVQATNGGFVNLASSTSGDLIDDGGEGILIQNALGAVNVLNAQLIDSVDTAINIQGGDGIFTFQDAEIVNATGTALNVDGGSAFIEFEGSIQNNSGYSVQVANTDSAQLLMENSTIDDTGADGLLISGNANSNVQFGDVTIQDSTGTAVTLVDNDDVSISFESLNVNNAGDGINPGSAQQGLFVDNSSGSLVIQGDSSIETVDANAVEIRGVPFDPTDDDDPRLELDIVFSNVSTSVDAGNFDHGILIENAAGSFRVNEGIIDGASQEGILLTNVETAEFQALNILNGASDAIRAEGIQNFSLTNGSVIENNDGHGLYLENRGVGTISVIGTSFDGNTDTAIAIQASGGSFSNPVDVFLNNNTIDNAPEKGIEFLLINPGRVDLLADNNTIISDDTGFELGSLAFGSVLNATLRGNRIDTVTDDSFIARTNPSATLRLLLGDPDPGGDDVPALGNRVSGDFILDRPINSTFQLGGDSDLTIPGSLEAFGNRSGPQDTPTPPSVVIPSANPTLVDPDAIPQPQP